MAGRLNLTIEQGSTWSRRLRWAGPDGVAIDTSAYTADMQIRERLDSDTVIIELTDANGRITLGLTDVNYFDGDPHILLELDSTDTDGLPQRGQATYDLLLTAPGGSVTRLLQGSVFWSGQVTR